MVARISQWLKTGTLVALLIAVASTAKAGDLSLHPLVMRELNQLVKTSDTLHVALVREDEEFLEIAIRDLVLQTDRVWGTSAQAKPHERYHLIKILDSLREHLEIAHSAYGEERRQSLVMVFRQLVNIVRIYRVNKTYGIYFCGRDKSTWIQKGIKAQNPFGVGTKSCGIKVPK